MKKKIHPFRLTLLALLLVAALCHQAFAAGEGAKLADYYLKKQPAPALASDLTLAQAMKIQTDFNKAIQPTFGKVVGYKAGLTNPNVQKAFGVAAPVRGTLMEKMILKSGTAIEANFGARPLYEGDLILRVGSDALNSAKTPMEALGGIDAAIPFIELPDLVFDAQVKLDGPHLLAINAGARLGVLGEPVRLPATEESVKRLADMQTDVVDQTGARLGGGKGSDVLENPLNAVLWLAASLRAEGKSLKDGDLLSLGSFSALLPPQAGSTVTVRYTGLGFAPVEVSVRFE